MPLDLKMAFEPKKGRLASAPIGLGPYSREWWCTRPPPPPITAVSAHEGGGTNRPPSIGYDDVIVVPNDDVPVRPFIYSGQQGWPQARIDHGKKGDELVHTYYMKHGTFSGALVYIRAGKETPPLSPPSSVYTSSVSSLDGSYRPHRDLPMSKEWIRWMNTLKEYQ